MRVGFFQASLIASARGCQGSPTFRTSKQQYVRKSFGSN